jgi:tripartite-type tricarboxylate transporter receptor subunit TctC
MNPVRMNRRSLLSTIATLSVAPLAGLPATRSWAQAAYPDKPIRLLVGFPPGGPTDVVARLIADKLKAALGQIVLVENRAGAGGNLAAEAAARSPADGYTLLYTSSAMATAPSLYERLAYNPKKDFVPVVETVTQPLVLAVNPSRMAAASFADFVRLAKERPDKFNYASSGNGTITHLAAAALCAQLGVRTTHVPYRGTAPALTDLVAGTVDFTVGVANNARPFIQDGKLRALAVTSLARLPNLPNVPTLHELGLQKFEATAWQGIMAPAATSPEIVQRLGTEVTKLLDLPAVKAQVLALDAEVRANSGARFGEYIEAETQRWARVVKEAGITPA